MLRILFADWNVPPWIVGFIAPVNICGPFVVGLSVAGPPLDMNMAKRYECEWKRKMASRN